MSTDSKVKSCKIKNCLNGASNCSFVYQECTRDLETCCTFGCCVNSIGLNYRAVAIAMQIISVVLVISSSWALLHATRKLRKAKAMLQDLSNNPLAESSIDTFAPTVLSFGPALAHQRGSDGLFPPLFLELSTTPSREASFLAAPPPPPPPPPSCQASEVQSQELTEWSVRQVDPSFPDFGSTDPPSLLETSNVHGTSMTPVSRNCDGARDDQHRFSPVRPVEHQPGQLPSADGQVASPASLEVQVPAGRSLGPEPASARVRPVEHQPGQLPSADGKATSPASLRVQVPAGRSLSPKLASATPSLRDSALLSDQDSDNRSQSSMSTLQCALFTALSNQAWTRRKI